MREKRTGPKIHDLHDLEGQRFWGMVLIMVGVLSLLYGTMLVLKTMDVALDQVEALTDRVEHLTESPSEPAKT